MANHDGREKGSPSTGLNWVTGHRVQIPIKLLSSIRVGSHPIRTTISPMTVRCLCTRHNKTAAMTSGCLMMLLEELGTEFSYA